MQNMQQNDLNSTVSSNGIKELLLKNKKLILIGVIILIFFIIFIVNFLISTKEIENFKTEEKKEESPTSSEIITFKVIYSFYGVIQEIQPEAIVFEADIPQTDRTGKLIPKKEIKKIDINSETQFTALGYEIHKETGKKMVKETKISFKDLKVGDYIEAIAGENIKDKEEFLANKIRTSPSSNKQ